jgi:hypothetical protein
MTQNLRLLPVAVSGLANLDAPLFTVIPSARDTIVPTVVRLRALSMTGRKLSGPDAQFIVRIWRGVGLDTASSIDGVDPDPAGMGTVLEGRYINGYLFSPELLSEHPFGPRSGLRIAWSPKTSWRFRPGISNLVLSVSQKTAQPQTVNVHTYFEGFVSMDW